MAGKSGRFARQESLHSLKNCNSADEPSAPSTPSAEAESSATSSAGFEAGGNIKVFVRVRPRSAQEAAACRPDEPELLSPLGCGRLQVGAGDSNMFKFDQVLGPEVSQHSLFEVVGRPMAESVLQGYNCCCFAYGQTGAGKTHTMQGDLRPDTSGTLNANRGLAPRVLELIFDSIKSREGRASVGSMSTGRTERTCSSVLRSPGHPASSATSGTGQEHSWGSPRARSADATVMRESSSCAASGLHLEDGARLGGAQPGAVVQYTCRCSFLQIYKEKIFDLLAMGDKEVQARYTHGGVLVDGLTEVIALNATDALKLLVDGAAKRKERETHMNRTSSRSHTVFSLRVEGREERGNGVVHVRTSTLHLVDLAGLERTRHAEGEGLAEAKQINLSLTTLGRVMKKIVECQQSGSRPNHIPYRDSKLTFFLQDSLGGNARTVVIANVSPSPASKVETLSTLQFARLAKRVYMRPRHNTAVQGEMPMGALRAEVERLQAELLASRVGMPTAACVSCMKLRARLAVAEADKLEASHRWNESAIKCKHLEDLLDQLRLSLSDQQTSIADLQQERTKLTSKQAALGKERSLWQRLARKHKSTAEGLSTQLEQVQPVGLHRSTFLPEYGLIGSGWSGEDYRYYTAGDGTVYDTFVDPPMAPCYRCEGDHWKNLCPTHEHWRKREAPRLQGPHKKRSYLRFLRMGP